jgi:hypothetical protein
VINFHLPGLVSGSYNRNGSEGRGRVATVPITAPPPSTSWSPALHESASSLHINCKCHSSVEWSIIYLP